MKDKSTIAVLVVLVILLVFYAVSRSKGASPASHFISEVSGAPLASVALGADKAHAARPPSVRGVRLRLRKDLPQVACAPYLRALFATIWATCVTSKR